MYHITYSKKAIKFLRKQSPEIQQRIINAIVKLPDGDVKKMQGRSGYRLRIGDFRVLYDQYGNIIDIININNRGQIYK